MESPKARAIVNAKTRDLDQKLAEAVYYETIRKGVQPIWDDEPNIRLYPALTIEEELLDKGLATIEEAIKKRLKRRDFDPTKCACTISSYQIVLLDFRKV